MIESAIFAHDDDDVLDRAGGVVVAIAPTELQWVASGAIVTEDR